VSTKGFLSPVRVCPSPAACWEPDWKTAAALAATNSSQVQKKPWRDTGEQGCGSVTIITDPDQTYKSFTDPDPLWIQIRIPDPLRIRIQDPDPFFLLTK